MGKLKFSGLPAALILCVVLIGGAFAIMLPQDYPAITPVLFGIQDVYLAPALIAVWLITLLIKPRLDLPHQLPSGRLVALGACVLALLLWLGTYLIMFDFPLTRDEHMVVFDQGIFSSGRLAAPLPAAWSGYALALVPAFLLDVPGNQLLVSAYMPMNAAFRTAFGLLLDPALMNPVFTGLGLILIYRLARKLFPDSVGAVWTVVLGYGLSAQILLNAMTDYAMTGHLFLNLLWLTLFLDGRRRALLGAMVIGFVAIGYHQVIFHLLFAGPFILELLTARRWRAFLAFALVYAGALLFWMSYPHLVIAYYGIVADSGSTASTSGFITERVISLIRTTDIYRFPNMVANLLRMITWAPIFLAPLLVMGLIAARKREGIAQHLVFGVVITIGAMMALLPSQGHGWGYRYIHPVLGNMLLLAGYGYRHAARSNRSLADRIVILQGAVTLLLVIPFLLWSTRAFVEPYARLTALISQQQTDFVIVDTSPPYSAIDEVRNQAALTNRPLVFSSRDMSAAQVEQLCQRGSITLVSRSAFDRVGFAPGQPLHPDFARLEAALAGRGCIRPLRP